MRHPISTLWPLLVAVFSLSAFSWGQSIAVKGSLALGSIGAVDMRGTTAYAAGTSFFYVVDATDPNSPHILGQVATGATSVSGLEVAGNFAACAGNGSGVIIIQVSDPAHPTVVSTYTVASLVRDVAMFDTLIGVATSTNVTLLGIRNPAHPHLLAGYGRAASSVDFDATGQKLFVGTTTGAFDLNVVVNHSGGDTTFSLAPHATYGSTPMTPISLASPFIDLVSGNQTLLALRADEFTLAGQYVTNGVIRAVSGGNNYCLLATATGTIELVNQSHNTPLFLTSATITSSPTGLALGQTGGQPLAVVSHTSGVTFLAYSPLDANDHPTAVLPEAIGLSAYPNPFNSTVSLRMDVPRAGSYDLTVSDALGRTVWSDRLQLTGTLTRNLDFSNYSAGTYFARLSNYRGGTTVKLLYIP